MFKKAHFPDKYNKYLSNNDKQIRMFASISQFIKKLFDLNRHIKFDVWGF